jgi:hypothetical protein
MFTVRIFLHLGQANVAVLSLEIWTRCMGVFPGGDVRGHFIVIRKG